MSEESQKKLSSVNKWVVIAIVIAIILGVVFYKTKINKSSSTVYVSNGRIEAVEIYISTKSPGRLKDILVNEGDFVKKNALLAVMDTDVLESELRQTQALFKQAEANITTAESQLRQRESEKVATVAAVSQAQAELEAAKKRSKRSSNLVKEGASSQQEVDDDRTRVKSTEAALLAVKARVTASEAAIQTAKSQLVSTKAAVDSAKAAVDRLNTEIADSTLKAPRDGRIQYRIVQPGEVLGAGGRVLNLLDLSDVYMTFFLPTDIVGLLTIGSETRIVLDAAKKFVIPATISFIADQAQFTPKTVETASEREKLMFRVRAKIAPELLQKHIMQVKTGLPGVIYVKRDNNTEWPPNLQVNLPE